MKRLSLFIVLLLNVAFLASAQNGGTQQNVLGKAGTFAIINARIVTVTGADIENGTIVLQDGKILDLGAGIVPPKGAEIIDGKGLSVFPGMIDAATNLGLVEIGQGLNASVDVSEVGMMNANAKAILGINPHSAHVNVTRNNGVTTVHSMPSGGTVAGQSAIINLWGANQTDMAVVPTFGLVVEFPRITLFGGFDPATGPIRVDFAEAVKRRDKAMDDLKAVFRDAIAYGKAQDAAKSDPTIPSPAVDLKLAAMVPYVRGEKPVVFTAERENDIKGVVKFVEDMKLKGVIVGGQEAWKVADGLKKNNISVVYTNMFSLPTRNDDAYDYFLEAPATMQKAGVKFCISTGDNGPVVRDLPYQAGWASAYGLPFDEALKSVTIYPAQMLGVADKLGSLEKGKIANIVVADGSILEPRTNVRYLFINGRMIPLTSRHTELFDAFKDRK